ncbi:MAG: diaminobutyrate--2-oxoglutarate transaminase [Micromonosporaceae bacterium]
MNVFETLESEVRSYCRGWPTTFTTAKGSRMYDEQGRDYLDFFAGAGTLNYGHNHPLLKQALIDYLSGDGVTHSLDMHTVAKRDLLETFQRLILEPRGLDYKIQFPGPTGANSVECALKLARKVTGRETVLSFTNAFHGMSLGALAVTGNSMKRRGAGVPLQHSMPIPYDDYLDGQTPDFVWLKALLEDSGSGLDTPAAIIVETVQGEGGVNVARAEWLRGLAEVCRRYDVLLIVDDVQMGCGRTGPFFSFEEAGIVPDIVCMSKSLSGYGLPLALTMFRSDLDVWEPGEHNGTFRGHNPAFVTATTALNHFWATDELTQQVAAKSQRISNALDEMAAEHTDIGPVTKGRGMVWGLTTDDPGLAGKMCAAAYDRGLLVETSGPLSEVVKVLPPLTITDDELDTGMAILADSLRAARAA